MDNLCSICGKPIGGYGNNPDPLCDWKDLHDYCCDECNMEKVLPARVLLTKYEECEDPTIPKVGDLVVIFWVHDDPNLQDHILRSGYITEIEENGNIHGDWGSVTLNAKSDRFVIVEE